MVGPICESGDWIGHDRDLSVQPGDLLAVLSAGAYCMSMASNYNTRNRAAEVLVDGNQTHLIRERESYADQMRLEHLTTATRPNADCSTCLFRRTLKFADGISASGHFFQIAPQAPTQ